MIAWVNYACCGVVPAKKIQFTVEQVTQVLHSFPKNAAAIILLPNRAGDLRGSPKLLDGRTLHNCVLFFVCPSPKHGCLFLTGYSHDPPKTTLNQTCLDFMFVFTGSCNWVRKDEKDEPMNDEDAADDEHGQVKKQEEGPA